MADGINYIGGMKDNVADGKGIISYPNGDQIMAEFKNGDLINELVSSNNHYRSNVRNKSRKVKEKTNKSGSLALISIAFFKGLFKKPNKRPNKRKKL